jgi:hypothetical protein
MKKFATNAPIPCPCGSVNSFEHVRSEILRCKQCDLTYFRHEEMWMPTRKAGVLEKDPLGVLGATVEMDEVLYHVIGRILVTTEEFKYWWFTLERKGTEELYVLLLMPFGKYFFQWSLVKRDWLAADADVDDLISIEGHQFRIKALFTPKSVVVEGENIWPRSNKMMRWALMAGKEAHDALLMSSDASTAYSLVDPRPIKMRWTEQTFGASRQCCPNCKEIFEWPDNALVMRFGCNACFHTFDVSDGDFKLLGKWDNTFRSILKLGGKVTIGQEDYLVLGLVVRELKTFQVNWKEYQLLAKNGCNYVLVEMNGHWTLSILDQTMPHVNINFNLKRQISHRSDEMQLFSRDYVDIAFTAGLSMYKWTDNNLYVDYIAPPVGITCELHPGYRLNYKNQYVSVRQMKANAELARSIPPTYGVAPLSPQWMSTKSPLFYKGLLVVILLLFIQSVFHSLTCSNQKVYSSAITPVAQSNPGLPSGDWGDPQVPNGVVITPSFKVTEAHSNLCFFGYIDVRNNWGTFEVRLINETTGEEKVFYKDIEYYDGVEEGVHWSEGSVHEDFIISNVTDGTYHMEVRCEQPVVQANAASFCVYQDVLVRSNLVLVLIVMAILLGLFLLFNHSREYKRYSNSEYSPYTYE